MSKFFCLYFGYWILFYLILLFCKNVNSEGERGVCEVDKPSECNKGRPGERDQTQNKQPNEIYLEESNIIVQNVERALRDHTSFALNDDANCTCHASVITSDLEPFRKEGVTQELIKSSSKYGTRYKILGHKLYREEQCMFPARCSGIEHFIKPLLQRLGDMDLVINTRDWPQIRSGFGPKHPVFSFSKTKDYSDIMYPAWSFWAGGPAISLHPTGIGRWDLQRTIITQAAEAVPWMEKLSKGFFRGSRTSDERDALVLLSRRAPELVDAQYTKNQAWKSPKDTLNAEPAKEVSFEEHCRYKYLFNFRGVAASFRLKHLFLCKSLVFHVGDEWNEFFYFAMKPWVHYVPLKSYPTEQELESMVRFFQQHDDLALQIAERGYDFIWKHLRMKDVECYWERLLTDYQKLIKYKVKAEKDMHAM